MTTIWHELECGAYAADLPHWAGLAAERGGPVLDLGCGSGRVGLHLARSGIDVVGLDRDEELVAAFNERAAGLPAEAKLGDACSFRLGRAFPLIIAPMQLIQLLGDEERRIACLACIAGHLQPDGLAVLAIAEDVEEASADQGAPPLPDARELDGWVYSSLPLETVVDPETLVVRRLRQTVSPHGDLDERLVEVELRNLSAGRLEAEAGAAGLRPGGRLLVEATPDHVGSTLVLLERGE